MLEKVAGISSSRYGLHGRSKIRFTQEEHEEITKDVHWRDKLTFTEDLKFTIGKTGVVPLDAKIR